MFIALARARERQEMHEYVDRHEQLWTFVVVSLFVELGMGWKDVGLFVDACSVTFFSGDMELICIQYSNVKALVDRSLTMTRCIVRGWKKMRRQARLRLLWLYLSHIFLNSSPSESTLEMSTS